MNKKTIFLSMAVLSFFTACKEDKKDNYNLEDTEFIEYGEVAFNNTNINEGLNLLKEEDWDISKVNKILNTFTYGIIASQEQIRIWSEMSSKEAIKEIITMNGFNEKLKNNANSFLDGQESKTEFIRQILDKRYTNSVYRFDGRLTNGELFSPLIIDNTNYNPTRIKIGLWETNYHQVVNGKIDALFSFNLYHYFDDIVEGINNSLNYEKILSKSAISTPIMLMYGQLNNTYHNGLFKVNDDFAREFHQLFFGILGKDYLKYYENITIENTAKLFTGMEPNNYSTFTTIDDERELRAPSYYIQENQLLHYSGNIRMLGTSINQSNIKEGIEKISDIAIRKNESMRNLPIMIVNGLADSFIKTTEETKQKIRNEWKNDIENADILKFIQKYAISYEFHNEDRIYYLSSLDRLTKSYNLLNFEGKRPYRHTELVNALKKENYIIFYPAKGVFGNLTGEDIQDNSNIFAAFYNRAANQEYSQIYRNMDFSKMIDEEVGDNVVDIVEFIWNRFIGDNLKNLGKMERLHLYSLLLYGEDYNSYKKTNIDYTEEYINEDENILFEIDNMSNTYADITELKIKTNLKYVTNFILGLPFMWFEEGK